jgi:hypothetical protein
MTIRRCPVPLEWSMVNTLRQRADIYHSRIMRLRTADTPRGEPRGGTVREAGREPLRRQEPTARYTRGSGRGSARKSVRRTGTAESGGSQTGGLRWRSLLPGRVGRSDRPARHRTGGGRPAPPRRPTDPQAGHRGGSGRGEAADRGARRGLRPGCLEQVPVRPPHHPRTVAVPVERRDPRAHRRDGRRASRCTSFSETRSSRGYRPPRGSTT